MACTSRAIKRASIIFLNQKGCSYENSIQNTSVSVAISPPPLNCHWYQPGQIDVSQEGDGEPEPEPEHPDAEGQEEEIQEGEEDFESQVECQMALHMGLRRRLLEQVGTSR